MKLGLLFALLLSALSFAACDNVLPQPLEDKVRRHLRDSRERERMMEEVAVVKTDKGTFALRFYGKETPQSVLHFRRLIQAEFYDGIRFHRSVTNPIPFVVQAGDEVTKGKPGVDFVWEAEATGKPVAGFSEAAQKVAFEKSGHKHLRGSLALAHRSSDTQAGTQFYITLAPQPRLDGKFTVFGEVIKGMDVVEKLQRGDKIISIRLVDESKI